MEISPLKIEDLTYEQALQELETVVSALETEELSLEMAIGLYERGQQLTAHCTKLLESAELRIQTIGEKENSDLV